MLQGLGKGDSRSLSPFPTPSRSTYGYSGLLPRKAAAEHPPLRTLDRRFPVEITRTYGPYMSSCGCTRGGAQIQRFQQPTLLKFPIVVPSAVPSFRNKK